MQKKNSMAHVLLPLERLVKGTGMGSVDVHIHFGGDHIQRLKKSLKRHYIENLSRRTPNFKNGFTFAKNAVTPPFIGGSRNMDVVESVQALKLILINSY